MIYIIRCAAIGALAVAAVSCAGEERSRLDRMVEQQNASCPMPIAKDVAVGKVSLSGDTVVYDVRVGGSLPVKQLSANAAEARRLVTRALVDSDSPEVRDELETCRAAGAVMKYMLTDERGDTFSVVIEPEKLKVKE